MAANAFDLPQHVKERLVARAPHIARTWLARLPEPEGAGGAEAVMLNLTTQLVQSTVAAATDHGARAAPETIGDLLHLRRTQGQGLPQFVRQFDLLEEIIFTEVDMAIRSYRGAVDVDTLLPLVMRLQTAIGALSRGALEIVTERLQQQAAQRVYQLENLSNSLNHELRNRLNTVHLLIERYKTDSLYLHRSSIMLDYLSRVQERLDTVKGVVEDVLSVETAEHRLDANSHARTFQALSRVVQDIADEVQDLAQQRNVLVLIAGSIPSIMVDATRVRLILINLLTNAIKYCNPARNDSFAEVSVSAREQGMWQVAVTDNGVGIAAADHEQVFRRYGRALSTEPGQGLGLFLAREAVTQIGGRIWVESVPGQGSTFYFTLPSPSEPSPESL